MAFAELQDLLDQLDFVVDEQGQRQATRRLEMASNMARHYSGINWPDDSFPAIVGDIVLNVVERYMRNPDAFTQSRAGDETLAWSDRTAGVSFYFTDAEREILAGLGQAPTRIGSISLTPWRSKSVPLDVRVPVDYGGMPFPWFAAGDRFRPGP